MDVKAARARSLILTLPHPHTWQVWGGAVGNDNVEYAHSPVAALAGASLSMVYFGDCE